MIENLNTSLNWNNLIPYRKDKNNLKVSITEKVKDNNNILSKPISKFEISVRTLNCFRNLNITILGQITELSEKYLLATPNFGKKSLEEIKSLLNHCGLKLNTKIDWSNSHPVIAESEIIKKKK
jgi:DNA-directed RNA polymerase subunit alpha